MTLFKIDVHVTSERASQESGQILKLLQTILKELNIMSESIDRLTQDVADLRTVEESAIALLTSLAQQIRDNIGDEAALAALADEIESQKTDLADAVAANTPAA